MSKEIKILIGVGIAAIAALVVFVWLIFSATSVLIEPIERQLTALKAGDIDAAYAETSEAFRQGTSKDDFAKFVDQFPILKNAASHSFTSRSFENDIGSVSGSLIAADGALTPITYQLVKENGAWKIVNIRVGGG
jgi:Domain of unknown function (DUF4864)